MRVVGQNFLYMVKFKMFIWSNGINSGCFQPHISQNVANSMPSLKVLPANCVVIPCWLSACPGKMESFINHSGTCERQTGWRKRPQTVELLTLVHTVKVILLLNSLGCGEK